MADPARVVVLAPNWLGDAVMAQPAIEDVRRRFPEARLIVAARSPVAPLFALIPEIDEVVHLAWNGRVADPGAFVRDVRRVRAARPDTAILLPNSFASALLARASSARERWGYRTDGRGRLLSRAIPPPAVSVHQSEYYRHLTSSFGVPRSAGAPRIVVPPRAVQEARARLQADGWDGARPLVVLAPGAAYGTAKRWPPTHFAHLATRLVSDAGAFVVLVGSAADAPTAAAIRDDIAPNVASHVADVCGQTTLESLAGVLTHARACVSNDSGAMHLAAAAGVPLAAVFGPTNERETAPAPRDGVPTHVLINEVPCRPCMLRECPIDHPCMRGLAPSRVYEVVNHMLMCRSGVSLPLAGGPP